MREVLHGFAATERSLTASNSVTSAAPSAGAETARHAAGQIAVAVANQQGRATEIALNPEELGRVRLSITAIDGAITLNVLTERPETNDLLRRHIDVLAQEFRDLGYDSIAFSFGAEGQSGTDQDAPRENDIQNAVPSEVTTSKALEDTGPKSGMDLRL